MKSLVALLVIAVPAIATPCRTVVYQQQAEVVVPYVQTQIITVAVPTYTLVPYPYPVASPVALAPANYTPPSAIPTAGPDVMQELLAEIRGMRAELKALVNTPPDLSPPKLGAPKQAGVDPAIVALTKNCAKCHGTTADKDGAGFVMFNPKGEYIPIAPRDARRIVSLVSTGKMPPPPAKCDPAEADLILKAFKP